MPDERTNSTTTWLNSPICGNQKAQTLVDMIQVGQWYGKHYQVRLNTHNELFFVKIELTNHDHDAG